MNLKRFREIEAERLREYMDCPAQFITLDGLNRSWVTRGLMLYMTLRVWQETNKMVFGKKWKRNGGLKYIAVIETDLKTKLWHLHVIQEKHPLLTYSRYSLLWYGLWEKEKEKRRWDRRGIDIADLHRREWPRKPVDVRPYEPGYHSWYVTKQVTESYLPFVANQPPYEVKP